MTLAVAQVKLAADLLQILQKAAFNAYMTQQNSGTSDGGVQMRMDIELNKAALKYSTKFATEAAQPMAKAIYDFTKEIGIMITNPLGLVAPMGPVAGIVPLTGFTVI